MVENSASAPGGVPDNWLCMGLAGDVGQQLMLGKFRTSLSTAHLELVSTSFCDIWSGGQLI